MAFDVGCDDSALPHASMGSLAADTHKYPPSWSAWGSTALLLTMLSAPPHVVQMNANVWPVDSVACDVTSTVA
eukprot:5098676-Amphidinium_carterae.1